ncbi:hypothetical protein ADUPG1_000749, partial [Aduncisulcus paluster]
MSEKSGLLALIFCIPPMGIFGLQHFYIGDICTGLIYLFTCGIFGFGWLFDLCTISDKVARKNAMNRTYHVPPTAVQVTGGAPNPLLAQFVQSTLTQQAVQQSQQAQLTQQLMQQQKETIEASRREKEYLAKQAREKEERERKEKEEKAREDKIREEMRKEFMIQQQQ